MIYDDEDDDEECLPIPRRCSLIGRNQLTTNDFSPDSEISTSDRRQSRLTFNNSISADSGIDEHIPTPKQLIELYEKTIELAAKNKINVNNAFQLSFVERLPEILNIIGFDNKIQFNNNHDNDGPNFIKVGSVIDTSAKIYGLRVDALHNETQIFSGSIQSQEDDEEEEEPMDIDSDQLKTMKKATQQGRRRSNSYVVSDLTTISMPYEFNFYPLQPSNMCKWPGGVGSETLYAEMVSYTMYSSSDFPVVNGFVNFDSRINMEYVDNESILDVTAEIMCDLIPLREIIKEYEGENHFLGCQILREFTFNEESTESYIETIDECSMFDNLSNEDDQNILSDLRDEGASFHYQDLQSTYVGPPIIPSMDMTVLPNKLSFVDSVPSLLREKTDPSDYTYFDATKLKLFAGPYVWKYINLLPDLIKPSLPTNQSTSINNNRLAKTSVHPLYKTRRNFKLDLSNHDKQRSVNELMAINPLSKSIIKKQKRTILTNISQHNHQLRLSRSFCSINELMRSNNIPELIFDDKIQNLLNNSDPYPIHDDNYIADCNDEPFDYNFIRPIHYDRIEFDRNFTKIDTKKLQYQLIDEYNTESSKSSSLPITFSTLCVNLLDKNSLSIEKNELISAFYCMLNNCNKNNLFMKNNIQQDDLIIQKQSFDNSIQLSYSHMIL
ncbi:unnamed protein product [Adineta steineri]|uniref:Condensin complex subunit 2 n=1 Tax=Adineta steineri TaxID=433720 RepID=A0A819M2P8_9BILA|nr:unnamed protein product [Adineta steineri]